VFRRPDPAGQLFKEAVFMQSGGDMSVDQLGAMIKLASGKLGISPEELRSILSDKGRTEELLSRIGGKKVFEAAMKDPDSLEKVTNDNPAAKKTLGGLFGGKQN
jgi:hypothetical protein